MLMMGCESNLHSRKIMAMRSITAFVLLMVSTGVQGTAFAQDTSATAEWVVIGIGRADPRPSASAHISYSFQGERYARTIFIEYNGDIPLFGGEPSHYTASLGGGIGKSWINKYVHIAQLVGPSLTYSMDRRSGEKRRAVSPGLAANLQFYLKPFAFAIPEIGIGIDLFANVNFAHSFYGVRFGVIMTNARW